MSYNLDTSKGDNISNKLCEYEEVM